MSPEGLLYFTDVTVGKYAGEIWKYNPQTGKAVVFRSPSAKANGLIFDAEGNLLAAEGADSGGRRITRTDIKTGVSVIFADNFRGKLFNAPNDIVVDMRGRIYFTDPRYLGDESIEQPFMGVYRIDLDGSVHLIAANATKPNGIAISPDQKTLYVANNDGPGAGIYGAVPEGFTGPVSTKQNEALLEYELLPDGSLKFKKQLIDLKNEGPDGIKVDREGNIYLALADSKKIAIYSSQGEKLAEIKIPVKEGIVTNLCFGRGKYSKTLFITATKTLYMIETKKEGFHIPFKQIR